MWQLYDQLWGKLGSFYFTIWSHCSQSVLMMMKKKEASSPTNKDALSFSNLLLLFCFRNFYIMAGHKSCCILSFICLFADPGHRRPYLGRSNNENGLSQTASPVQQLTKAFFFYLFRSKGDKIRVSNCVFKNFYHLHATISTRLFFSLTKLLMMISYSITFPFFF